MLHSIVGSDLPENSHTHTQNHQAICLSIAQEAVAKRVSQRTSGPCRTTNVCEYTRRPGYSPRIPHQPQPAPTAAPSPITASQLLLKILKQTCCMERIHNVGRAQLGFLVTQTELNNHKTDNSKRNTNTQLHNFALHTRSPNETVAGVGTGTIAARLAAQYSKTLVVSSRDIVEDPNTAPSCSFTTRRMGMDEKSSSPKDSSYLNSLPYDPFVLDNTWLAPHTSDTHTI